MTADPYAAPPAGATALVTGATGFTGSVLVRRLVERGVRVTAIARRGSRLDHLAAVDVTWVRGEVDDPETIGAATVGVEYVFHLAAAYREARRSEADYRRVHVTSTERLAERVARRPGFRRFVHVSTIGVHGHIADPPADERAPFRPDDDYQRTKAAAEEWLHDFARAQSLPYTVIRPCAIYGPGDRRLWKLFRLVRWGVFPLLGSGRGLYHLIHVDDLVAALMRAAVHPAADGESFIAGNREWTTLEHMARVIAGALGRRVRVVRLPVRPFMMAAAACEAVCRPLGLEPPLHRRRVAFYTKDRAFDTSKLRQVLGFIPSHGTDEGLVEAARWYVDRGWLPASRSDR